MSQNEDEQRNILLEHARHPKHVGEIMDADGKGQCHNPLCGDKIAVSIMSKDGILQSIKILPSGCSISTASASLMTELIKGKSIAEVEGFITSVNEHFSPANAHKEWPEKLKLLSPLKRIRENPLKIPCVLISWVALKEALKNYHSSTRIENNDKVETRKDT
jgi:nitrogen fixation NifU-like protein